MNSQIRPVPQPVPPADLDAEAAVLSALLLDPDRIAAVRAVLRPGHFYADANRRIYESILELADDGRAVDTVSVVGRLRDNGRIDQVGGAVYVAQIVDATPAVAHVLDHAKLVVEKHAARRAIDDTRLVLARLTSGAPLATVRPVFADLLARADGTDQEPATKLRTLRERLVAARLAGQKHPTGIQALDVHLRGGLRAQKTLVVGGAPGAGKTTMMVQIGRHLAKHGVAVGFLAVDEEAAGIDARNLESIGIDRDRAEQPDEEAIEEAERELGDLPFCIFEDVLVEDVFEELARLYPDQPRAVLIDSLQTARSRQSDAIEAIRERTTDVIITAKRCARAPETEAFVLLTSELARGAYRSKQAADQIEDLAAFKESGAVEYQAHVALVLRTVKGDSALVQAAIPKNRTGTKGTFGLRLDFERATFHPASLPSEDHDEEDTVSMNRGRVEADSKVLAGLIMRHQGIGERDLRTELRSAGHSWGRDRLDAAKKVLVDGQTGSRLVNRGDARASSWHLEGVQNG